MSQHYTYTAADLERYHSGKMGAEEMNALEKAALEDPFLADALEGYVYTGTPLKDVAELRERLFAKSKKKNVFFLMSKQNAWLRMAAMFILIVGIGYLALQLNSTTQKKELAITQDSPSIKDTSSPAVAEPDPIINEKEGLAVTTPGVTGNSAVKKENKLPQPDLQITEDDYEQSKVFLRDQNMQSAAAPQLQKNSRDINILRGRIVDTMGNPLSYATISDKDKKISTTSDSTGRFTMPSNDSTLTATISFIGFKTKEKKLGNTAEEVIVMEPERALSEVVVTAYGARRSEKALGYATTKMKQAEMAADDSNFKTLKERTVFNEFNEYVKRNIKIPVDQSGKNYKGTVILSFETNKKGTPKKIKVVQSLCTACDKEAIRLLTEGPKWRYTKARQNVPIQF